MVAKDPIIKPTIKNIFEIKKFYTIIFIISLLSLLTALYIEFFLGYSPCKLCIYQRIPYLVSIFLTFLFNNDKISEVTSKSVLPITTFFFSIITDFLLFSFASWIFLINAPKA